MSSQPRFEDVLLKLANGESIDWDAVERSSSGPEDVAFLRQLRILEQLGRAHKATSEVSSIPTGDVRLTRAASLEETATARRWGRYSLVSELGAGSYGSVYLAHDEELNRHVAIKLLHQSPALSDLAARVRREGQALARVRQANVITVYDVEEHEQQLGLCMEYIDGRTLHDIVKTDGPLNADEAVVVGQAVGRALAALHAAGVVHQDVKARNVMRERAGRIVLMDLGAGLDLKTRRAITGAGIGTPVYMAPELFEGVDASPQTDTYALGVLLYFLATGEYPVTGQSAEEVKEHHRRGRRTNLDERRPDLPTWFVAVVDRATAPGCEQRYPSVAALLRDLNAANERAALSGGPKTGVDVPGGSSKETTAKPAGVGHVALMFGGGAAAIAGLAILSGLLTTYAFNAAIDRPRAFDPDTLASTVATGVSSLVVPTVVVGALLGFGAVLNLLLKLMPWFGRALRRVARPFSLGLQAHEYAVVLAQVTVVVGFLAVGVVYATHRDVMFSFVSSLNSDGLDKFKPLRPESRDRRLIYRMIVPAVFLLVTVGWQAVRRARLQRGGTVPRWVHGAGLALVGVLFYFSQAPYKLMARNLMPVVLVDGDRCYRLGQRADETRVYCPTSPIPRVRTLRTADKTIQSCGFEENVFLAPTVTGCTPAAEPRRSTTGQ